MKIAVTYLDGEVFGHFGKTPSFKIYDVNDSAITDSAVVEAEGQGHGALAAILFDKGVNVLICGGLGEGAKLALEGAGIEVVSGASGNADAAVEAYLKGELVSEGVNCDHHEEEQSGCDCGSEGGCGGCGGGCGGCGGGCGGARQPLFEGPNVGKACIVNYKGTFNDGTCFDSSFERGEPIQFICGVGMMIAGFDKAVATMKVGETVDVHLMPEEAYGPYNPDAVLDLNIAQLPGSEDLNVGDQVYLANAFGQEFPVKVLEKTAETIKLDANHEMAGKELNFTIELVDIIEE